MIARLLVTASLLCLAACGGSDKVDAAAGNAVSAKAVADVDAAMADAQRTREAPAAAAAP